MLLSADDIEPHHLKITVDGDRFRVEAIDAKAGFKVKEEAKREATLDPSNIQIGRYYPAPLAPALSGDHRLRSSEPAHEGIQRDRVFPGRSVVPL